MRLEIEEIDAPRPTLCLNMIVKNESKIIRRLMESVSPIIDCYCICDTGSTDDTIEIINTFFSEKNIAYNIWPVHHNMAVASSQTTAPNLKALIISQSFTTCS
jgi:glycosyltransferase involved in cell wall biosynthesis